MSVLQFRSTVLAFVFSSTLMAQNFHPVLADRLQHTLDSLMEIFSTTVGVSAGVYYPEQGQWLGTHGISFSGQPLETGMGFGIASNSKLFASVAILLMEEDGLLDLDDAIGTWIPAFENIPPQATIRQLLNHTSGIADNVFTTSSTYYLDSILAHPDRIFTPEEIISWVDPPLFPPGSSYFYSNINYILAGMIAEIAGGQPLSVRIRDHILDPLALDSTFYDIAEPVAGQLAHRWYEEVDFHDTSRISLNSASGAAGSIFSTTSEMLQWYQALMNGQILSESSFAAMTQFASPGNYGLGLQQNQFFGNLLWYHSGSTAGYRSQIAYDPCSGAIVCGLSNSTPSAVAGTTLLLYKVLVDYLPGCPGAITGPTEACQGQNAWSYSVPAIPHADTYIWDLPAGATGSSSTNSIQITFGPNAVSGLLTVRGVNDYGIGGAASLAIQLPPPLTITGDDNVCSDGISSYATASVPGAVYQWTIIGGIILSGQGTSSITVQWNNGVVGTVSVERWIF